MVATPVRFVWRPITRWPREQTTSRERSPFLHPRSQDSGGSWRRPEIGWEETQVDLVRELRALGVDECVIQLALTDRDIRIDGEMRANARLAHPGVIVTFTAPRKGVLTFACDKWETWQANIRATSRRASKPSAPSTATGSPPPVSNIRVGRNCPPVSPSPPAPNRSR